MGFPSRFIIKLRGKMKKLLKDAKFKRKWTACGMSSEVMLLKDSDNMSILED
jgi:hypothetical protein